MITAVFQNLCVTIYIVSTNPTILILSSFVCEFDKESIWWDLKLFGTNDHHDKMMCRV